MVDSSEIAGRGGAFLTYFNSDDQYNNLVLGMGASREA